MGFFFKRRIKVCKGVYLNASKNGLGLSYGVKGFRISHNAKGQSYLNAGRYGMYYRKRLDNSKRKVQPGFENADKEYQSSLSYLHHLEKVKGDFDYSIFEPSEYMLDELMAFNEFKSGLFNVLQVICFLIGCFIHWFWLVNIALLLWIKKESKNFIIHPNEDIIHDLKNIFDNISDNYILHNAFTHEELQYGILEVNNLFSCKVPFINLKDYKMCFLDQGILFYSNKVTFLIPYEKFNISLEETTASMIFPPAYAKTLSVTYEHTNKDGSPNKRYKINREIHEIPAYVLILKVDKDICIPLVFFDKKITQNIYDCIEILIEGAKR